MKPGGGGRAGASPFSLPLSATLNYMFSGEMARTPAGVRRPQSTIHPTTATDHLVVPRSCILQPPRRCSAVLQRGEGETKPCRKEDGGRPAATATVYTLQCNRELTYALETGARALPLPPALASLIACCLQTAP